MAAGKEGPNKSGTADCCQTGTCSGGNSKQQEKAGEDSEADSDDSEGPRGCCDDETCGGGDGGPDEAPRKNHPADRIPGVIFPPANAAALAQVLNARDAASAVCVKDLKLPHDAEKLELAFVLWAEGFVCNTASKKSSNPQAAQAAAKKAKH